MLPVFPLPDTVLFPGTALPLHIFEPRYVAMVTDAIEGDGVIAIAMLKNSDHQMDEQASIHATACAGQIVHYEPQPGGRFNILLHGIERVSLLEEQPLHNGYRRFKAEPCLIPDAKTLHDAEDALARLQSCVISLQETAQGKDSQLLEVLGSTDDPLALADILSAVLVPSARDRQRLLDTPDLSTRLGLLIDHVATVMLSLSGPNEDMPLN